MDPALNQNSSPSTLNSDPSPVVVRREPERDILVWTAPARIFIQRNKQFYVPVFAIAGIISLILFLAEGIMPVVLIISLVFLFYILSTVPPDNIEYKITSKGVKIAGKLNEWQTLTKFWFVKKSGGEVLIFETVSIPGRLELVINPETESDLKREISAYIPYEEVEMTSFEKLTTWFVSKLPGGK